MNASAQLATSSKPASEASLNTPQMRRILASSFLGSAIEFYDFMLYAVGAAAPLALVALRIIQGFAVGGEWGGAMLIALEHSPGGKRGFAASFANLGAPAGSILSAGILGLFSLMPDEQFLSWGWRVPFLLSIVLVLIGLFIRLKVVESPLFLAFDREAEQRRVPLVQVLTKSPWVVVLGTAVAMSQLTISGMASVWGLSHATAQGTDATFALNAKVASAAAMFVTAIIAARLSDRFGRRIVIACGIGAAVLFAYPLLLLVDSGTDWGFAAAVVVGQGIQGIILGPLAAFLAEMFPTAVRFTGSSLAFQGASAIGAGFTPIVAGSLMASAGGLPLLGAVWIVVLLVCAGALFLAPEGSKRDLADIV
jgi:MFS family permease